MSAPTRRGFVILAGGTSVSGPSAGTSTDNAIPRWDGTTGRTLQDSAVTIADTTGAITIAGDTTISRSGANGLVLPDNLSNVGTLDWTFTAATGANLTLVSSASHSILLKPAGTTALTLASTLNAVFAGTIIAATPVSTTTTGAVSAATYRTAENNIGATAISARTLPTAVAGAEFTFVVDDTDGIQVIANTGDVIRIAGNTGTAAGSTTSTTVGSVLRLLAIDATYWDATAVVGTWTNPT